MKLLKIYSEGCGPCKVMEKNLTAANIEHESVNVNSEKGEALIEKYNIRAVPTLLIIDENGNLLDKKVGIINVQQLKEFISEFER